MLTRDIKGVPIVCTPWTVREDQDFDECMKRQRAIDTAYGYNAPLF